MIFSTYVRLLSFTTRQTGRWKRSRRWWLTQKRTSMTTGNSMTCKQASLQLLEYYVCPHLSNARRNVIEPCYMLSIGLAEVQLVKACGSPGHWERSKQLHTWVASNC